MKNEERKTGECEFMIILVFPLTFSCYIYSCFLFMIFSLQIYLYLQQQIECFNLLFITNNNQIALVKVFPFNGFPFFLGFKLEIAQRVCRYEEASLVLKIADILRHKDQWKEMKTEINIIHRILPSNMRFLLSLLFVSNIFLCFIVSKLFLVIFFII